MFSFWIYVGGKLIYKLVDNFSVKFIRLKQQGGGRGIKKGEKNKMVEGGPGGGGK